MNPTAPTPWNLTNDGYLRAANGYIVIDGHNFDKEGRGVLRFIADTINQIETINKCFGDGDREAFMKRYAELDKRNDELAIALDAEKKESAFAQIMSNAYREVAMGLAKNSGPTNLKHWIDHEAERIMAKTDARPLRHGE